MLTYIFIICALGGGTIVLAQLILTAFAFGAGHGLHLHHHAGGSALHRGPAGMPRGAVHQPGQRVRIHVRHGPKAAAAKSLPAKAAAPATGGKAIQPAARPSLLNNWAVSYLLGIFNFQGIVAALTVLGFAGLAASAAKLSLTLTFLIAGASAMVMMMLVGALLRMMVSMDTDNTVQIDQAVGQVGTVYLSIPAAGSGQGKIMVNLQQRLMEFPAITQQAAPLASGDQVIVIAVQKPSVMEVVSAEKYLRDVGPLQAGPAPQ